jgi:thiamine-phosphate pyrophosphorylase
LLFYYITDRRQVGGSEELLRAIGRAAQAGIDFIQLRERDLSARELEQLAGAAMREVARSKTKLLINSRADIAIACGAAGVHLRSDDVSASDARAIYANAGGRDPVIGVSCHSEREVLLAEAHGADFAVLGPVFEKSGSSEAALGLEPFARLRARGGRTMPVLALGGITEENAAQCVQAGADGIAAIRLFQREDVGETVARLRRLSTNS